MIFFKENNKRPIHILTKVTKKIIIFNIILNVYIYKKREYREREKKSFF
jgi:hypothetical protein